MQQIVLVRHGEAFDAGAGMADADRPLTPDGHATARAVGNDLASVLDRVDRLVSSELRRARETADGIADAVAPNHREMFQGLAPEANPDGVFYWLAEQPAADATVLVGHEPQMNQLLGLALCGAPRGIAQFRKAGVAIIAFAGTPAPGEGRLDAFLPPRMAFRPREA